MNGRTGADLLHRVTTDGIPSNIFSDAGLIRELWMITQRVRKNGSSLAITIPQEEAERLGLQDGDLVVLQLNKAEVRVQLPDDIRSVAETVLCDHAEDIVYLADR
jgi:antitoxin component of MazEF toxin-antitoxin module